MATRLADDELLDVPMGNLTPGELARSYRGRAAHTLRAEEAEAAGQSNFSSTRCLVHKAVRRPNGNDAERNPSSNRPLLDSEDLGQSVGVG